MSTQGEEYGQESALPQGEGLSRKRPGEFEGDSGDGSSGAQSGGFGGDSGGDGSFRKKSKLDEGSGGEDNQPATLRVLIRNSDAGGIIGKGGENIKRLRKQYDCQVVLPDSAGSPERVMTMMGAITNCVGVLDDVLNGMASDYRSSQAGDGDKEIQILIPQPFMGTIIGTGGTKIKELRTRTKTNIKIFSDPMPGSNERSVQMIGSNAQIMQCVQHILEDIEKKEPREPIYLYEPGQEFGGGPPPPDMGFRGRGGRGQSFRGGRGRGRGGDTGGGTWRDGGGRRGGGGGGGMRGGRGGRFNGSNQGSGFQYGSPPQTGSGYGGGAPTPSGGNVGYGSTAPPPTNQPSVGYTTNQPPPQNIPAGPAMGATAGPPSLLPPSSYRPPGVPPPAAVPLSNFSQAPLQQQQGPPVAHSYPGSQMPQQPPPHGGNQSQQVTIPAEYADAILGNNGGNIHQIRTQSSCEINLEPLKLGSNERIITIVGTASGIQFAQQLMQNSVRQYHPHI